jgi:hypothetical protein
VMGELPEVGADVGWPAASSGTTATYRVRLSIIATLTFPSPMNISLSLTAVQSQKDGECDSVHHRVTVPNDGVLLTDQDNLWVRVCRLLVSETVALLVGVGVKESERDCSLEGLRCDGVVDGIAVAFESITLRDAEGVRATSIVVVAVGLRVDALLSVALVVPLGGLTLMGNEFVSREGVREWVGGDRLLLMLKESVALLSVADLVARKVTCVAVSDAVRLCSTVSEGEGPLHDSSRVADEEVVAAKDSVTDAMEVGVSVGPVNSFESVPLNENVALSV